MPLGDFRPRNDGVRSAPGRPLGGGQRVPGRARRGAPRHLALVACSWRTLMKAAARGSAAFITLADGQSFSLENVVRSEQSEPVDGCDDLSRYRPSGESYLMIALEYDRQNRQHLDLAPPPADPPTEPIGADHAH